MSYLGKITTSSLWASLTKCAFFLICLMVQVQFLNGQISSYEEQLQFELNRKGISEEEFRELLIDAGYNPDRLNELSALEVADIEQLLTAFELDRFRRQYSSQRTDTIKLGDEEILPETIILDSLDTVSIITDTIYEAIWGHQLFRSGQISVIRPEQGFRPPETYILGVGDNITVSIFGQARVEDDLTVLDDGSVRIFEGNVKITVAGLMVQEARLKLERAYRRVYRFSPNQFNIYVSAIRNVRVSIYGEVIAPGDYNVSAANGITQLITLAGGLTDDGSVRNIQLIKRTGESVNFDLYELLVRPDATKSFALEDGDNLLVPVAAKTASIEGAVKREHTYELKPSEGLFDLIEFAGGLSSGAYLGSVKVYRFEENKRVVLDVPYAEKVKKQEDFPLKLGDVVEISKIEETLENFVAVTGEVRNEGKYELLENMSLKDILELAGLKPTTKRDLAYLKRLNENGNVNMIPISIDDALNGVGSSSLIIMQDQDELIVWPKERFTENKNVKIDGAVRIPEEFEYDNGGSVKIRDLINYAGGLRSDAADYAHVHRLDPLNPNQKEYIKVDLSRLMNDPNSADNVVLEPFDSVYVYSRNEFQDELFVRVSGAVSSPGSFIYGSGMTIEDVIIMAGGFKQSSATNRIEVSRVIFEENRSTRTVIHEVSINRNELGRTGGDSFILEPFDNVYVRYVPGFELQQNVVIEGEVVVPGEYALIKDNETVKEIIDRAGGLTKEAFPGAAKLYRSEDSVGYIVMRLEEALANPMSRYNYTLTNGDTIYIPKGYSYVKIIGATQYLEQSGEKQTTVPFHDGKDALFYIDTYAGGFADNARRDKVFVKYPNGQINKTKKGFLFGKRYPKVVPGAEINVWTVQRNLRDEREKEEVNWTKVLGDSVAQAMSILTLILLVQRLD